MVPLCSDMSTYVNSFCEIYAIPKSELNMITNDIQNSKYENRISYYYLCILQATILFKISIPG